ncbi:MAG: response regulator [Lachnospiraceae bacterium]|nr:response regulator [Lachnospiraceae bacterium]
MIQKKILCKDFEAAKSAVSQLSGIISQTKHKSGVITIYEKGFSKQEIDILLGLIRDSGHSEIKIAGIALTMIAELMPEGMGALFNLILAEQSDIEVLRIPCAPGGESDAAAILRGRLDADPYARAVELFTSNMELKTTVFIEESMKGHEDVVLFGTSTIRNFSKKVSIEIGEEGYEISQAGEDVDSKEFIIADEVLTDGFAVVVFSGENLKADAEYALGWKPIGRKLPFQLGTNPLKGETVVKEIKSLPAVDIYREYLGVYPDEYFISNICEFPLMVERDGINMCMVPLECGEKGELYFMMTLHQGEELRFTFASHDEVLNASRESLDKLEAFGPEALFLTLCGNRVNFLKEDAHLEWDGFGKVVPDYALMHGAGELYYYNGKGGILNSAHLAIGLREGENTAEQKVYEHPTVESLRQGRTLSLSDRMSTFLGKITSELVETANQAQEANKAKSAFLSHMSHEIRTPINAILGMDEMILKESGEENVREYADSIHSAGNNLLGIVNDILDFSKIEAGRMSIVPAEYELINLIKDMYNVVRLRAEDKGLKVVLDIDSRIPSVLYGDSTRIKQVITNILTNAVKYTEKGTVTFIAKKISDGTEADAEALLKSCPGDETPDKTVRLMFSVKDTGMGIKPEDMERLFEEYVRFDEKRNIKVEGTGLGMSITNELLELMGSRLNVESVYGEGSEFGFEIMQGVASDEPFGDIEGRLNKPVTQKKRMKFTAEDARILVVDDTKVNLSIVTKLLKNTKIVVDTAGSGAEAIGLVQENKYDIIFLDHLMPELDGPETLKRMNALENNKSAGVPVISLTSNAMSNAKEEYLKLGFKDYLSKPFKPEELEDMLFYHIPPEKVRTVTE